MKYRSDIDGLRAVAVLAVLFFHCGLPIAPGGFVGVDIFFVISGFVITGTLLRDLELGRFSIASFYERRVRRIFPALIFTFIFCWVLAWLLFLPADFLDFSKSMLASALSVSNMYFWKTSGYFDTNALLRPLLHTWSLSVEEQFYLFAPAAVWICYKYLNSRYLYVFVPVAIISFALSAITTASAPTANFFLLPTRAWELLLGVILAVGRPANISRNICAAISLIGAALIAYSIFGYSRFTPFPGFNALAPCFGAAMVIFGGSYGPNIVSNSLSWRPLVGVGLISYSLYLFHWPLLVFARYATLRLLTPFESSAIIVASFALAIFSWRFVEQPFRHRTSTRRMLPIGLGAMAAMIGVAWIGIATNGAQWRFPDAIQQEASSTEDTWRTGQCFFMGAVDPRLWRPDACKRTSHGSRNVLLWGDSFAAHYTPGLEALDGDIDANVYQYTVAGCPPIFSYYSYARPGCQALNAHVADIIRDNHISDVVLSSRWTELQQRGLDPLQETVDQLKALGVNVWVIGQSPEFATGTDVIDYKNRHSPKKVDSWPVALESDINAELRRVSVGAHFINPLDYLCRENSCTYRDDNDHLLFVDYGHFSKYGSMLAVRQYFPFYRDKLGKENAQK